MKTSGDFIAQVKKKKKKSIVDNLLTVNILQQLFKLMSRLKILLLNLPWPARGNLRHELRGPGWVGFPLIGRYIKNIRKILIQHQVEVKNNTKKHKTFSEWTFWNLSPPPFFFYTVQNKLVHLKHAQNRFFSKFYVDGEIEEWNYVDVWMWWTDAVRSRRSDTSDSNTWSA